MNHEITRRMKIMLPIILLVAFAVLLAAGYVLAVQVRDNTNITEQIQAERIRNTRSSCEQRNREHLALREFFKGIVPRHRLDEARVRAYLKLAERSFPVVDCDAYVRQSVSGG
jgi:hypothetical protein